MPFSLRSMTNLFEATRSTEHGKIVSKSAAKTISFYSETPYLGLFSKGKAQISKRKTWFGSISLHFGAKLEQ